MTTSAGASKGKAVIMTAVGSKYTFIKLCVYNSSYSVSQDMGYRGQNILDYVSPQFR